jgi:ATP-dependent DNA helicase DinG
VFIAEAGTGTGKTFAYLVPALQSNGKVIVSTGTKTLQDQLFNKDLPMVRDILKAPVKIALLGARQYVCPYHLQRSLADGRFLTSEDAADARRISVFAKTRRPATRPNASRSREFPGVEQPPRRATTASARNARTTRNASSCGAREAMAADLVVVNHHLFFADVMLRDEGMAELLPACNTVIFDEAHQLPEVATLFFGDTVSTAQVVDLARDTRAEA